jgi:threonine synthase
MRYVSTRGDAPELGFDEVLLAGLARDGGLYVPEHWPQLDLEHLARNARRPYPEIAIEVMWPFVSGTLSRGTFEELVFAAYSTFDDRAVAPLRPLGAGTSLLELWHGPTLAFKDVALQLVGRLFDRVLTDRGERITIVGATSGDTGSAAIEACRDRSAIEIFILHPAGRVSDVQRRQMTTVASGNVHNLAVEGTFDDCQDLVKALFADESFRERARLSAVNSINWARVMAQIVYYVTSWLAVADRGPISFAVPTGNFGNVFAAYAAARMGLPVERFVVGSNRNDILTRFLETGTMATTEVHPTLSPSMDIQVSSNFERLLFELLDRDGAAVARTMAAFRRDGGFTLDERRLGALGERWTGVRIDDDQTLRIIEETWEAHGQLVDPHTAVAIGAAQAQAPSDVPMVVLSTAHPAKFPDAVHTATGIRPSLPERMRDLFERPERLVTLPNDLAAVRGHIDVRLPPEPAVE